MGCAPEEQHKIGDVVIKAYGHMFLLDKDMVALGSSFEIDLSKKGELMVTYVVRD